jgi:GNAT superfamily N-acetyltransferase
MNAWNLRPATTVVQRLEPFVISVRPFTPEDHTRLALLFGEMQAHYDVPCPSAEQIVHDLRNLPGGAEILVAEADGELIGFAAFSAIYPGPGLTPGLFLKDLFVTEAARGRGAGRHLMRAVAGTALRRGFKRVDWTADRNNPKLLAFYEGFGASQKTEKAFYRLEGEALGRFKDS